MIRRRNWFLVTILAFGLGRAAAGQSPATPPSPPSPPSPTAPPLLKQGIRAAVQVKAMDLDVVVTKGGQPVSDLAKNELAVRVDGKPFPLDYFTKVTAGTLYGPDLETASPDLLLETLRNDSGDRYLPRHFLIYFDDEHMVPFERNRVIEGVRDLVTRLSPSDRVSILSYRTSGTSRVMVPFTNSKEDILDALDKLEKLPPGGLKWETQYRQEVTDAMRSPRSRGALIRNWSQRSFQREKNTLEDLRRAVAVLAARGGKRVLLYISSGLELRPGQSFQQALGTNPLAQFDYSVTDRFDAVVAEANRSGVTIDAIDARGITTDGTDASEQSPSPFNAFLTSQNYKEALAGFARETGGVLVTNRNDFKGAMDRIYQEATTYYSIGVTLTNLDPRKKDHKVDVTSTRPGVSVRVRRSYGAKSAEEASRDRMEMALLNPDIKGDFPVELSLGVPKKGGGLGHRLVPYVVQIPIGSLTFLDEGGKKKAAFEVCLAAVQDTGARSGVGVDRKEVLIEPADFERAQKGSYKYTGELKSGTGNLRFVTTVRDLTADRVGIASAPVRVE